LWVLQVLNIKGSRLTLLSPLQRRLTRKITLVNSFTLQQEHFYAYFPTLLIDLLKNFLGRSPFLKNLLNSKLYEQEISNLHLCLTDIVDAERCLANNLIITGGSTVIPRTASTIQRGQEKQLYPIVKPVTILAKKRF